MIPIAFDYAVPATIDEALALLREHGDGAKLLTGGHSLIPMLKLRLAQPSLVVDLRRVPGLAAIERDGSELVVGALATHAAIAASKDAREACALLGETALEIGDPQVRNLGTIGGSIVHADPAADWPAALIASHAIVVLRGSKGERRVPADAFFVGLMESAAKPGEIVTAVRVPVVPKGTGHAYRKLAQSASGFAICGVAALVAVDGDRITSARLGITGVGECPYRPGAVEEALVDCPTDADSVKAACRLAADGVAALGDIHASSDYRSHLAGVFAARAVLAAIERTGRR